MSATIDIQFYTDQELRLWVLQTILDSEVADELNGSQIKRLAFDLTESLRVKAEEAKG